MQPQTFASKLTAVVCIQYDDERQHALECSMSNRGDLRGPAQPLTLPRSPPRKGIARFPCAAVSLRCTSEGLPALRCGLASVRQRLETEASRIA